jgi:hypothetical protein
MNRKEAMNIITSSLKWANNTNWDESIKPQWYYIEKKYKVNQDNFDAKFLEAKVVLDMK